MGKASKGKRQQLLERLKRQQENRNKVNNPPSAHSSHDKEQKDIFKGRFFYYSIAAATIFILIWTGLNVISNKNFSASISSADKIEFKVKLKPGDSLKKSPLCNLEISLKLTTPFRFKLTTYSAGN